MEFKINDYVYIKNTKDIYIIININNDKCTLKGLVIRIFIETDISNIEHATIEDVNNIYNNIENTLNKFKTSSKKRNNNKLI